MTWRKFRWLDDALSKGHDMNINSAFSTSLKADDLQGKKPILTIDRVEVEKVGEDKKPVLYFVGKEKGLILNRTNSNTLVELLGTAETDAWHGHRIQLITAMVDYQGKRVPAIRLQAPQVPVAVAPPPPPPVATGAFDDSDIPF